MINIIFFYSFNFDVHYIPPPPGKIASRDSNEKFNYVTIVSEQKKKKSKNQLPKDSISV